MKRSFFPVAAVVTAAVICSLWAAVNPPAGTIIESFESREATSLIGKSGGYQLKQAQQFYLDEDDPLPLSGVGILLNATDYGNPAGDLTIEICANAGGNVPGTPVAGSAAVCTPALGEWNYISYSGPAPVLAKGSDNTYWIVVSIPEQSGNDAYRWERSTHSSDYSRGYRKTFNTGGTGEWSGAQPGDFSFRIYGDASLSVSGSSCRARQTGSGVQVAWRTESEVNIAGFNVLRSRDPYGGYRKLNVSVIPVRGEGSFGAAYTFLDRSAPAAGVVYYMIEELLLDGGREPSAPFSVTIGEEAAVPADPELLGNYPNPFNPATRIQYRIPAGCGRGRVAMDVFDILGKKVAGLALPSLTPGLHEAAWDGRDASGRGVPGGVYICRMHTGTGASSTLRIVKSN
ncbi:hypothetical protein JXO52_05095 [bacterium]|nr:hypothetical protein [bacterium]